MDDTGRITRKERQALILTGGEINPDALLDDCEVAALLNCSVQQLRIGRAKEGRMLRDGKEHVKNLPPHRVLWGRLVRYRYGDLLAWMANAG